MNGSEGSFDLGPSEETAWNEALNQMELCNKNGDYEHALDFAKRAWEILPDPKLRCSYAYITAMPLLKAFAYAKKSDEGGRFADFLVENTPLKNEIGVFLVQKGIIFYESNRLEEALSAFKRAWSSSGEFGFLDEEKKYLNFLTSKMRES